MKKILLITLLFFLFLAPISTQAGLVPCGYDIDEDGKFEENEMCQLCDIFVLINNIIRFVMTRLVPIVAALMIVVGGFYFLIAGPSPELYGKGKSILTAVIIGLVIVFLAWVFLSTFLTYIGVATWTGLENWWEIPCR